MTLTFDDCFNRLVYAEGKLSLDPTDRGNWTGGEVNDGELRGSKYGISAAAYPTLDIAGLTLALVKPIYMRDFWTRMKCAQYDSALAFQMFDAAVNHSPGTAIRFLQRAVGVADDGDAGPVTLRALAGLSVAEAIARFNAERLEFYPKLSGWAQNGRGWINRIAANLRYLSTDT